MAPMGSSSMDVSTRPAGVSTMAVAGAMDRQGLDARAGAAGGDAFEQLAKGEEEHHERGFLGGPDHDGAGDRDGHQHLDREDRAVASGHEGAPNDRDGAGDAGREVQELRGVGEQAGFHIRCRDQRSGKDHKVPLRSIPPRTPYCRRVGGMV